jgi:hypothetical protein
VVQKKMNGEAWKYLVQVLVGLFTAGYIWVGNTAWETRAMIYRTHDLVQILIVRTEERYDVNEFRIDQTDD